MKTLPTPEQLEAAVLNWNEKHPSGTPVRRFAMMNPRGGDSMDTTTRSEAWLMGGHSPVVLVEGFTGAMHLDQLEVIEQQPTHIPDASTLPPAVATEAPSMVIPAWLLEETFAIQHNPNCPARFAVRLIGHGFGRLDLEQYQNPTAPDFTKDKMGFGATVEQAAENARIARG